MVKFERRWIIYLIWFFWDPFDIDSGYFWNFGAICRRTILTRLYSCLIYHRVTAEFSGILFNFLSIFLSKVTDGFRCHHKIHKDSFFGILWGRSWLQSWLNSIRNWSIESAIQFVIELLVWWWVSCETLSWFIKDSFTIICHCMSIIFFFQGSLSIITGDDWPLHTVISNVSSASVWYHW